VPSLSFAGLCDAMVTAWGEEDSVVCAGGLLGRWAADGLIAATP
jgi:hypothetical protein